MSEWYVRDRGRVTGPFTEAQLRDLRTQGRLSGFHEVSTDRRAWHTIDRIPGISTAPPSPPPPVARLLEPPDSTDPPATAPQPPTSEPTRRVAPVLLVAGGAGVVLLLFLCGGLLVWAVR